MQLWGEGFSGQRDKGNLSQDLEIGARTLKRCLEHGGEGKDGR